MITIDRRGVDIRLRFGSDFQIKRLCFDHHVDTPEQAFAALQRMTTGTSGETLSDAVGIGGVDID